MSEKAKTICTLLMGGCMGFISSGILDACLPPESELIRSPIKSIRTFEEEGKPTIMRVYRANARDGFFIQDPLHKDTYLPLEGYLDRYQSDVSKEYKAITEE